MTDDPRNAIGAQPDLANLERLVISAFEQTRSTGRKDWTVMTVPVLKNRLLDLTNREFSAASFGAGSMTELVGLLPELVDLDTSSKPPRVRLRDHTAMSASASVPHLRYQIRRDLWNAIVDFGRGERYLWSEGAAVPESARRDPAEDVKALPTLTREEELGWRADFLGRIAHQIEDGAAVQHQGAARRGPGQVE
jgi:hypothetical protein